MINDKKKYRILLIFVLLFCLFSEAFLEYLLHKRFIFLWDDLWYSTNLVTNQPLNNLYDIWESQQWHYINWGGRSITHGLLQFILSQGEQFANLLNLIVTFTLSYFICQLAGAKGLLMYSISFFSLIALNTDIKLSMFWQSGSANYLYSTNWILLFLMVYLRELKGSPAKPLKFITLWIIPLGLITGWSTENMGPACFLSALMATIYLKFVRKEKPPLWMWIGIITSLLGSIIMITAPGNFIRSSHIDDLPLYAAIYERFFMMLIACMSFLFPTILCLLLFLYLYLKAGNHLQPFQIILMLTATLAYGAMLLSPTFPNRAAFGIMTLCIVVICSFIQGIIEKNIHCAKSIFLFSLCLWLLGMYDLMLCILLPI